MIDYIINNEVCALIKDNKKTKIIIANEELFVNKELNEFLDQNCKYYGSNLNGRIDSSKYILGSFYKLPIVLSELKKIVFFPSLSKNNKDCIWFNLKNIEKYEKNINNNTVVTFNNKKKIELNLTISIFEKQILRASRLYNIFFERNN